VGLAGVRVVVDVDKGQAKEALVAKEVRIGAESVIYTCPMHPEVKEKAPGKCPKCGMNLEPKS
jgi:rubrerythrin